MQPTEGHEPGRLCRKRGFCVSPKAPSQKPSLLYGGGHEKDEQNIFNETNKNAKGDLMFKETINQN